MLRNYILSTLLLLSLIAFFSCTQSPDGDFYNNTTNTDLISLSVSEIFTAERKDAVSFAVDTGVSASGKAIFKESEVIQILKDGSSVSGLMFDEALISSPEIFSLVAGADESVYCTFKYPVQLVTEDGTAANAWVTIIRILPDGSVIPVWPEDPATTSYENADINASDSNMSDVDKQTLDSDGGFLFFKEKKLYKYTPDSTSGSISVRADLTTLASGMLPYDFVINAQGDMIIVSCDAPYTSGFVGDSSNTANVRVDHITSQNSFENLIYAKTMSSSFQILSTEKLFYFVLSDGLYDDYPSGVYQIELNSSGHNIYRPVGRYLVSKGGGIDSLAWNINAAWYPSSALIIQNTDNSWAWNSSLIKNNIIDETLLYQHMRSYYQSGFSIKDGTLDYLNNSENFQTILNQLRDSTNSFQGMTDFCETYFNGTLNELHHIVEDGIPVFQDKSDWYINSIQEIMLLSDGVYAFSRPNPLKIFKLFDLSGNNDVQNIEWNDKSEKDDTTGAWVNRIDPNSPILRQGKYLYFTISHDENVSSSLQAVYDFGRIDIQTGNTEYFGSAIGKTLKIHDFNVDSGNSELYFSGSDVSSGDIVNGILDLQQLNWSVVDSIGELESIESLN